MDSLQHPLASTIFGVAGGFLGALLLTIRDRKLRTSDENHSVTRLVETLQATCAGLEPLFKLPIGEHGHVALGSYGRTLIPLLKDLVVRFDVVLGWFHELRAVQFFDATQVLCLVELETRLRRFNQLVPSTDIVEILAEGLDQTAIEHLRAIQRELSVLSESLIDRRSS